MEEMDLLGALLRGGSSALVVAALLLAAQRWGRDLAGLLAGLPIVTGPALVWLALDRGADFASQAAYGAALASVPCALFAFVYAVRARTQGRLAALVAASLAGLPTLWLVADWTLQLPATLLLVAATCTACLARMPRTAARIVAHVSRTTALRSGAMTVAVSGTVTAVASLLAQALGPQWAGLLTSPPCWPPPWSGNCTARAAPRACRTFCAATPRAWWDAACSQQCSAC
jgi:hypothetical protein